MTPADTNTADAFAAGQREAREADRIALVDALNLPTETTWEDAVNSAALLPAALAESQATIANERGEGEAPIPGFHWSLGRWAWVYQPWLMVPKETGPERVVRLGPLGWELYLDGLRTREEYRSARVAMADSATVAAKGGDGG